MDLAFGAVTVVSGTLGTLGGGVLLDKAGSTMRNAALLCCVALGGGGAALLAAFALAPSFPVFAAMLGVGELLLFASAAPSNALAMWSVPPGLRPLAMSVSVVAMHVAGDVPSPPLLGLLQSWLADWRRSLSALSGLLFLGAAAYTAAAAACAAAVDFRTVSELGSEEWSEMSEGGARPEAADLERGRGAVGTASQCDSPPR